MSSHLYAGFAQCDITPPAGTPMGAFPASHEPMQPRIAEGCHDPIMARAWALQQGETTVVICVADVVSFQWSDVDLMRAAFQQETGLPAHALIVCGTHNHNGPECTYLFGGDPHASYMDTVRAGVVDAAVDAVSRLCCAKVAYGFVRADLSFNRRRTSANRSFEQVHGNSEREPHGPVDPKVAVLRFERADGASLGSILHFAAHPVILTTPNRLFTAEYPGETCRRFAQKTRVSALLFLQGAAGDTHPYEAITNDYANVEQMGENLAQAATQAWQNTTPLAHPELCVSRWTASLPNRVSEQHAVRIESTVVQLSPDHVLVFWQGEPFVELSLALQWRSPFAHTVVVGYSLGWVGYVPTRNAYEFGGYGVDAYTIDPPELSRTAVPPGTGELLIDRTAELLGRMRNSGEPHD